MGEHLSGRQKVTGSIPVGSTKITWRRLLIGLGTLPFKEYNAGSTPVGATNYFRSEHFLVDMIAWICYNKTIESDERNSLFFDIVV